MIKDIADLTKPEIKMLPPYYKGYEMLERNDVKVSRSVLRRERASNRPYLVDHLIQDLF